MIVPFFRLLRLLALGVGLAGGLRAQVQLTEFLASNDNGLADEDGDRPDWIELHNPTAQTVNLLDWSLTDDPDLPGKWRLPATNLAAGSYLVVFASGKDRAVPGLRLHANFALNAAGEYLALFPPEGGVPATEFAPAYPAQQPDISHGFRLGQQLFFPVPTPGAANGAGFADFVADTRFSHGRGYHEQAFDLVITCATPDATIRYTTNGVAPTAGTGIVYTGPIRIAGTSVIRAAAFKTGLQPSNVDTQTYLFLADVIRQSPNGQPPPGWPSSWGSNVRDYGMDPDVVDSPTYRDEIIPALRSLPAICLVTDLNHLFNSTTGIYANPGQDGREWERPASVELLQPDGADGFQIDAGLRIRGGFSRSTSNPKHAFRLFFRNEYGAGKLRFPLYGDAGTDEFDGVDLRTFQNYSWSFQGDGRGVFIRDVFSRDTQLAMGQQGERGRYCHLFINGQYWGIFDAVERPEASYASSYFGGDKEDFDVIKVGPDQGYNIYATDGTLQAWSQLYNLMRAGITNNTAYFRVQGRNPDGTVNPAYDNLIEVDNLIDYMLVILFGGNLDAPISNFLGNESPNNFFAFRDRTGASGGFRFVSHDAEHTLLNVNENRTGPYPAGSSSLTKSNPQYFWQQLSANEEFRVRVADRVHRYFFNGGLLTPEAARARFGARTNQLFSAVVAESARWGDSKVTTPFTRNGHWLPQVNGIMGSHFNQRSANVLAQFRQKNLYPSVEAPAFSRHGGNIDAAFRLTMSAPAGTIFYTTDGTDPRVLGGGLSPAARTYAAGTQLAFAENTRVRARVRSGTTWSALNEADFTLIQTWTDLAVTELMYNPLPEGDTDGDDFEFLELKNLAAVERDLGGVRFTNGISFTFPNGTRLAPGQFAVLVSDRDAFTSRYPQVPVAGVYSGNLANGGERLTLVHAAGAVIADFSYGDAPPWPASADGGGFSLVPVNPNLTGDPANAAHWRASSAGGGSPGADDPVSNLPRIVVNEVLTHTDPPLTDSVELHNPGTVPADLTGWYLTDDRNEPKKFRIPAGRTIPAGGYLVLNEGDFNQAGAAGAFSFSSHGEEAWLFSADAQGSLTGYSDGFAFGAAANGVSFGRHTNSVGEVQFPAQRERTLGMANSGPRVGPVVITEFTYQPLSGDVEFVEIQNLTALPVDLFDPAFPANRWRLSGVGFDFPEGLTLPAGGLAVVTAGDPTLFRARFSIPDSVPVLGPFSGNLQDGGERLELQRPDAPDTVTNQLGQVQVIVPYLAVDSVRYNDRAPWPAEAAGLGASLERRPADTYGDDPAAWRASLAGPSPGFDNDVNRPPRPDAGLDQQLVDAVFPLSATLAATATDDGQPGGALAFRWTQTGGPAGVVFTSPNAASTAVALPGTGAFLFRVTVSDGEREAADEVAITVTRAAGDITFLAPGSTWRYLDNGTDQGTAWRASAFNDSAWKSGPAKFGYGDTQTTVVSFGPDAGNKYLTTYFRTRFNVAAVASVTEATVRLLRDDGAVVYLNGTEIFRSNMPEGTVGHLTPASSAIGGAEETTFYDSPIDPALLREGENVLAVEVHQNNGGSSDLGFDLALVGRRLPGNTPPTANAGADRIATAGEPLSLLATFTDDALPTPPGAPTFTWSKTSGPGDVLFLPGNSPRTDAVFSAAGTYVLQFAVNDGASTGTDELTVTVSPGTAEPPVVTVTGGANPVLRFTTQAARSYSVLARERLDTGAWFKVLDVPAGAGGQMVEVPLLGEDDTRYFQVVTPAVP